jgi:hypothetical protein
MREKKKICWVSAGVSSFIAGYLAKDVDEYIYIDIEDQHEDSLRFIKDCEKVLGKQIKILKSDKYKNVSDVIRKNRFINSPFGAPCTRELKKRVRLKWENENKQFDLTYVWGMDCNEKHRAERIKKTYMEYEHEFPLIDKQLTKEDAHGLLKELEIRRPAMYDLGYQNNNCIGCVKGGMWYWNKIRRDFPGVFKERAELEREIGHRILKAKYLDELKETDGRKSDEIMQECSILCILAKEEKESRGETND